MHLLVINPNTTATITETLVTAGRAIAPAGVTIRGVTGHFGARYISSRAAAAIAGHAAIDAYARQHAEAGETQIDAVLLACFGDPGLLALRELADCPVLGLAEQSCLAACAMADRFSIITGGERWPAMLEEFVAGMGLLDRLASIRAVAPTGGEIAANPEAAHAALAEAANTAIRDDGAGVVILGGAGLVGIAAKIAPHVARPVLCSVETGFKAAFSQNPAQFRKPESGSFAYPAPVASAGLGLALAARLSQKHFTPDPVGQNFLRRR